MTVISGHRWPSVRTDVWSNTYSGKAHRQSSRDSGNAPFLYEVNLKGLFVTLK